MKRLLLLLGARSYRAADFLAAARKLGIELVIGGDRDDPLSREGRDGASAPTLALDLGDPAAALDAILAAHRAHAFDAVLAADDAATVLAAQASAAIGHLASLAESVVSAGDKLVFREICTAAGLPQPWFRDVLLRDDPRRIARELRFPCVIKPLHLSASRGVMRCDDAAHFERAFARLSALLGRADVRRRDEGKAERILVEGYLAGAEVALEGLVIDGRFEPLAFFDKPDPLEGPYFEETIYVTPSRHPAAIQERTVELVRRTVSALGLRTGPVHAEARIDGGSVTVVELAPRSIGGHCGRTLRFGSGMTLEELILVQALGKMPPTLQREKFAAGVMMIPIPQAGILRAVDGAAAARQVRGIEDVEIAIPAGEFIEPPPEGDRYLGFIFARGSSPGSVEASLRAAHAKLRIEIEPANRDAKEIQARV